LQRDKWIPKVNETDLWEVFGNEKKKENFTYTIKVFAQQVLGKALKKV
jgi:hypothetical protein